MPDYKTLYQPQTPTQPQPLTPNQLYMRESNMAVWIPVWKSVFGGLAVGVLSMAVGLKLGDRFEHIGGLALFLAACVGSILLLYRMHQDDVRLFLAAYGERQDKATRDALENEVTQLRRELKDARSAGVISGKVEMLMAVERLLHDLYDQGLKIDRRSAEERGYKRDVVRAAYNAMLAAGVIDNHSQPKATCFAESWAKVLRSQSSGTGVFAVAENGDIVRQK